MTATDPTAQPATPGLDLDAIEQRFHHYDNLSHQIGSSFSEDLIAAADRSVADVPELLAEVRRLREQCDNARGWLALRDGELVSANAQRDAARAERDMLAKAVVHPDRLVDATKLDAAPAAPCGCRSADEHAKVTAAGLAASAAPAAPRTYALPAEPAETVTELWDRDGVKWGRDPDDGSWRPADDPEGFGIPWCEALEYGPLSTVPPAGTEGDR